MLKIFQGVESFTNSITRCFYEYELIDPSSSCLSHTFLGKYLLFALSLINYTLSREQSQHPSNRLMDHRLKI